MRSIFKYKIEISERSQILMPMNSTILDVQFQKVDTYNQQLVIWVLVYPEARLNERRTFRVFGTGSHVNEAENLDHISTVQDGQGYVWHVFEVK